MKCFPFDCAQGQGDLAGRVSLGRHTDYFLLQVVPPSRVIQISLLPVSRLREPAHRYELRQHQVLLLDARF